MNKESLLAFFNQNQLEFTLYEHEPLFTVEQGKHIQATIPGAHSKNLFLKDKKQLFYLVSILEHKRLDIKSFAKIQSNGNCSFASEPALMDKMKLSPGSVTPLGLIHDIPPSIHFYLDEDFLQYPIVNFHPLINNATISMPLRSFLKFFELIQHPPHVIKIPELI